VPVVQDFHNNQARLVPEHKVLILYLVLLLPPAAVAVAAPFREDPVEQVEDLLIMMVQAVLVTLPLRPLHREIMEEPQVQHLFMVGAAVVLVQLVQTQLVQLQVMVAMDRHHLFQDRQYHMQVEVEVAHIRALVQPVTVAQEAVEMVQKLV
jgi:hypothetical protein